MMLGHIGGVPVEESLLYVAPIVVVVGWMYFSGWRERRRRSTGAPDKRSPVSPPE